MTIVFWSLISISCFICYFFIFRIVFQDFTVFLLKIYFIFFFQIVLIVCLCSLVAGQRRIAKPIPLGFNPKPYSAQIPPKPTPSAPAQYSPRQYDTQYSTPTPFSAAPQQYRADPDPAQSREYVTPIPIIRFDKEQSIDGSYHARCVKCGVTVEQLAGRLSHSPLVFDNTWQISNTLFSKLL